MLNLPTKQPWFTRLLTWSIPIGLVGGLAATSYTLVTDRPIGWLFGESTSAYFSGDWWWIPLTAVGGLAVSALRSMLDVSGPVASGIQILERAWVDRRQALALVGLSIVSLVTGASLGPSYGIILLGAAFGSWVGGRSGFGTDTGAPAEDRELGDLEREFVRTGAAGGLGAVFTDPVLGTVFTMELSPTKGSQWASTLPRLIAAVLGYVVFFGILGSSMLNSFSLPDYEFERIHLAYGVLMGVFSVGVLVAFSLIATTVAAALGRITDPKIRSVLGGTAVGALAYAIPMTVGSGNGQLVFATDNYATFGVGFIIVVLIAKIVAIALSQAAGFLGGNVFPVLFVGGMAGFLVHALFPDIPVALAVSTMMAAVPGATLAAPIAIALVAAGGVGLSTSSMPPIIVAVIVAQLGMAALTARRANPAG